MPRDSMRGELQLAVLLYIRRKLLKSEKQFAAGNHFVDKSGEALPPNASALSDVHRRCIGGAVIEALVELGLESDASPTSHGYKTIMYTLGDELPATSGREKVQAVLDVNNKQGYAATRKLIDEAAERLYRMNK
jgi:hypothetical protein